MDFFLIPQGQALSLLMNTILSLDDGNNVSWSMNKKWILHYLSLVSTALIFRWQCVFNLCPNHITRNVICFTAALFTCYKQNEIKYSPWETVCAVIWNEDCFSLYCTHNSDERWESIMLHVGVKDGVNTAVTEKIAPTKCWIECRSTVCKFNTMQHQNHVYHITKGQLNAGWI